MMYETIGERRQRRRTRIRQVAVSLVVILIAGMMVKFLLTAASQPPLDIVRGTGATMEVAFVAPDEFEVTWDRVDGQAWSVSLVEGRIRNISNKTVGFDGLVLYVKDDNGNVIWEDADERFVDSGGRLGPMEYFNFHYHPILKREATTFELVVEGF